MMTSEQDPRRAFRRVSRSGAAAAALLLVATTATAAGTPTDANAMSANDMSTAGMNGNTMTAPATPQSPAGQAIASQLSGLSTDDDQNKAIKAFYQARNDRPVWFQGNGQPTQAASTLIQYIHGVSGQGLSPAAYLQGPLANGLPQLSGNNPSALATADLAMSQTFEKLGHDLHHGVIDDNSVRVQWRQPNSPVNYQQALAQASSGNPTQILNGLAPQQSQYAALVKALAHYQQLADNGGWPTIGDGQVIKKGMTDPRIATLWQRLQVTGDAPQNTPVPSSYNDTVMNAVRHFQNRNGLKTDGLLGPNTRSTLNITAAQRVDDIKMNMERWRWMPGSFGKRYIAVNVPAYHLQAVNQNGQTLGMDVIVGESYDGKQTPIFGDSLEYLVFRPYWNVPPDIANRDIVPKARSNPNYLSSHHFQIVKTFSPNAKPLALNAHNIDEVAQGDLLVRQKGGSYNALGLVKFIFPNHHSVYLHSTSAKQLFGRHSRDLSHGCVRVAEPVKLAQFALADKPGWDKSRIENAMHSGGLKKVSLAQSIPVYMLYWTAFVGPDGTMNFRDDLYGHDKSLAKALKDDSQITL